MELKQKIANTTLFSDEDKVSIMAALETYDASDLESLEAIIDEFDARHQEAVSEYKSSVYEALNEIVKKAAPSDKQRFQNAASDIRAGVDAMLQ